MTDISVRLFTLWRRQFHPALERVTTWAVHQIDIGNDYRCNTEEGLVFSWLTCAQSRHHSLRRTHSFFGYHGSSLDFPQQSSWEQQVAA